MGWVCTKGVGMESGVLCVPDSQEQCITWQLCTYGCISSLCKWFSRCGVFVSRPRPPLKVTFVSHSASVLSGHLVKAWGTHT